MARPTLNTNPKYQALIRRMARQGLWQATVRGLLEELWDSAHESGNPVYPNAEQVEAAAKWEGEPGKFAADLVDLKFLDVLENGNLEIHDYWCHAPDYVIKRAAREAERTAKGKTLSQLRAEAGRKGNLERWQTDRKRQQIASTPAPAPAPLNKNMPEKFQKMEIANGGHLPSTEIENAQEAHRDTQTTQDEERRTEEADRAAASQPDPAIAMEVYKAYPRHEAKKRAIEAIEIAIEKHGAERILAATRAYALRNRNTDPKYLPYAARWFDEERYLDHETSTSTGTKTDRTQEAIEQGQAMLDSGASYADTMSRLHDQFGDETAGRAVRLAGWKRSSYPGRQTA